MGKGPKAPANTLGNQGNLSNLFGSMATGLGGQSTSTLAPVQNYYTSLLNGGQGAQNVVAPSAMNIRSVYGGNQRAIQNFLPQGGEKNYALAQNDLAKTGSIANLYANVQPMAAQSLASLGGLQGQLAQGYGGLGTQGYGNLIQYQAGQNAAKGQALGGIGAGLGSLGGMGLASYLYKH